MSSRILIRHAPGFLALVLALFAGAVGPTNADTEGPAATTVANEASEPTEAPTKTPPPSRPSSAPT